MECTIGYATTKPITTGSRDPLHRTGHVVAGSPGMHFTSHTFKLTGAAKTKEERYLYNAAIEDTKNRQKRVSPSRTKGILLQSARWCGSPNTAIAVQWISIAQKQSLGFTWMRLVAHECRMQYTHQWSIVSGKCFSLSFLSDLLRVFLARRFLTLQL